MYLQGYKPKITMSANLLSLHIFTLTYLCGLYQNSTYFEQITSSQTVNCLAHDNSFASFSCHFAFCVEAAFVYIAASHLLEVNL